MTDAQKARRLRAWKMKENGATLAEIGVAFGVSKSTAQELATSGRNIEAWDPKLNFQNPVDANRR